MLQRILIPRFVLFGLDDIPCFGVYLFFVLCRFAPSCSPTYPCHIKLAVILVPLFYFSTKPLTDYRTNVDKALWSRLEFRHESTGYYIKTSSSRGIRDAAYARGGFIIAHRRAGHRQNYQPNATRVGTPLHAHRSAPRKYHLPLMARTLASPPLKTRPRTMRAACLMYRTWHWRAQEPLLWLRSSPAELGALRPGHPLQFLWLLMAPASPTEGMSARRPDPESHTGRLRAACGAGDTRRR